MSSPTATGDKYNKKREIKKFKCIARFRTLLSSYEIILLFEVFRKIVKNYIKDSKIIKL